MSAVALLILGAGAWLLPLPGGWRFATSAATIRRCVALGGGVAVTTLIALDERHEPFGGIATRATAFWAAGAVVFAIAGRVPLRAVERLAWLPAGAGLVLQLLALTGSSAADNITIAVPIAGRVLVSDLARAGLLLTTAVIVARLGFVLSQQLRARVVRPLLALAAVWGASIGISVLAKDLGGAAVSGLTFVVLAFLILNTLRPAALLLIVGANAFVIACLALPHALRRIQIFVAPPTSAEIEQTQLALFASSSGGWVGHRDGGKGLQYLGSTLDDDFLLAAIGRVLGLTGILAVIVVVFTAACTCLLSASRLARFETRTWLATGLGVLIGVQAVLAIGGVLGVVPETGVPIPLVTGSGTSLLVGATLLGLVFGSSHEAPT